MTVMLFTYYYEDKWSHQNSHEFGIMLLRTIAFKSESKPFVWGPVILKASHKIKNKLKETIM